MLSKRVKIGLQTVYHDFMHEGMPTRSAIQATVNVAKRVGLPETEVREFLEGRYIRKPQRRVRNSRKYSL